MRSSLKSLLNHNIFIMKKFQNSTDSFILNSISQKVDKILEANQEWKIITSKGLYDLEMMLLG